MVLEYILAVVLTLVKYTLLALFLYVLYLIFWLIYCPYKNRQYFMKYSNVKVSDKFYPMLGDIAVWNKNTEQKLPSFHHHVQEVLENPETDFRFMQLGERGILECVSSRAMDEIQKLMPNMVDRTEPKNTPVTNMMPGTYVNLRSTPHNMKRKKAMIDYLGINKASRYIPILIEAVDTHIESLETGQEVNFSIISKYITFESLSKQLLGTDYKELDIDFEYQDPYTGKMSSISFSEFFRILCDNEFEAFISPKAKLLQFLAERYLIEPYKTNHRNCLYFRKRLEELVNKSKDKESMYYALMKTGNFTAEECIMDLLVIILAGFDTTSRVIWSCLYYIKKHPDVFKKLMDEIRKYKLDCVEEVSYEKLRDAFLNCDYLTYVVKESLRIDPPAPLSLTLRSFEEVDVWGVTIPKGHDIFIGVTYINYNPKEWHRPTEFLPERFNPNSELFFKPDTKVMRDPKSMNSFSNGKRKCIGQVLGMQSAKVVLARLLTKVDYEVTQELMDRVKPSFDLYSKTDLMIKIK